MRRQGVTEMLVPAVGVRACVGGGGVCGSVYTDTGGGSC